jgi:serine/threonine protein kinase
VDGTPFGRYRLVELLGQGGMGEVWRAFDPVIDRVVALKVLPSNFASDQVFQERFRREARAAAGLNEPHVVPIHDAGEIEGRLYVTMRLIEGRDLTALLDAGPLDPTRAVGIIEQIASALYAAHRIGLVHRDVKPSNILIAEDDFAYLIDFGIARAAGETGLTSTGATIGTWAYMAPERFRTGAADARADVYALACVLHQCLTGQLPFPGDSLEQVAAAHMFEPPPRPSALRGGVPVEMDEVIATGMAKEPERRYATTKDLARAAHAALNAAIPQPKPATTAPAIADDPTSPPAITATAAWQEASAQPPTLNAPKPYSQPLAEPPRTRSHRRRWMVAAAVVIALLACGAVLTTVVLTGGFTTGGPKVSQEDQVRRTIQDFDTAIQKGDLAELRGITCGSTRDYYVLYPDDDWAAAHERAVTAKQYPVVASIDQVVVNGQHAQANVTTFMAYAPQVRSVRSFALQFLDGRWKICEGPIS